MNLLNITTIITESTTHVLRNGELPKIIFSWYDIALFCLMLVLSALIGIYFGCFGEKQSTTDEYLMGSKKMKVFPVAMSLVASNISGITLLAVPTDVYRFGVTYWLACIIIIGVCIITIKVYLPVFYKLQLTSSYEYLKLRFDTRLRVLASFLFAVAGILYLPIVIYVPALAVSQATTISIHYISPIVCGVCIFYTTLGGLKAVVWTDALQFSVTIGAMAAVFCLGIVSAGGMGAIFSKAYESHRLEIDFGWDPTLRDSFWAMCLGWSINSLSHLAVHQGAVQKFLSVPTFFDAKMTVVSYCIGAVIVKTVTVITGLIMYAKYYDCDPIESNRLQHADQLLPYYVMDVAGKIPGLPGLFISGIFCASLSTLSAVLNCLSGTIYEDFVSTFMPKDTSQKTISNIMKLIVVIVGVVSTSLVFIVEHMGGLLPLAISFGSVTSGPLLGLFTLGMLFPKANAKGAYYGAIVSLIFIFWVLIGAQWYKAQGLIRYIPKPVSTANCDFDFTPKHNSTMFDAPPEVFFLYKISHYYYTVVGALVCIIFGYPISLLTRNINDPPVNKDYLSPIVHFLVEEKPIKSKGEYYSIDKALHIVSK